MHATDRYGNRSNILEIEHNVWTDCSEKGRNVLDRDPTSTVPKVNVFNIWQLVHKYVEMYWDSMFNFRQENFRMTPNEIHVQGF